MTTKSWLAIFMLRLYEVLHSSVIGNNLHPMMINLHNTKGQRGSGARTAMQPQFRAVCL